MFARLGVALLCLALSAVAAAGPKIQHWTLANGARVYFVPARELPMVQLRVVFDAGSQHDPADKHGLARLTGQLLREGTGDLAADDVARRFEGLGAEFGAGADRETATVSLRSLVDSTLFEPALDLAARLIASPSFPEESLTRERERTRVALKKEAQNPGAVVQKAVFRAMYGNHPYAFDPTGDDPGLTAISRADLLAHHRRFYTGRNAIVAIVGDLSEGEARRVAARLVGELPAGSAAPAVSVAVAPPTREDTIAFPATQTHIRLGRPALAFHDPDYFPLTVGNYILGGSGLVSRLAVAVREQRGLSYSIYSYFHPMRTPGPFLLGLQTRNDQRQEALKVVREVLGKFIADGPTPEELVAAKKYLTGSFPLRLDSGAKIADQLAAIAFYRLPLTWLDDYPARVQQVTQTQIRDAFRRHVPPDGFVTIIVGGAR